MKKGRRKDEGEWFKNKEKEKKNRERGFEKDLKRIWGREK